MLRDLFCCHFSEKGPLFWQFNESKLRYITKKCLRFSEKSPLIYYEEGPSFQDLTVIIPTETSRPNFGRLFTVDFLYRIQIG